VQDGSANKSVAEICGICNADEFFEFPADITDFGVMAPLPMVYCQAGCGTLFHAACTHGWEGYISLLPVDVKPKAKATVCSAECAQTL
jgi:hypothetical protein